MVQGLNSLIHSSSLTARSTTIHLKVVRVYSDPRPVLDHEVPILKKSIIPSEWDLTTQQVSFVSFQALSPEKKKKKALHAVKSMSQSGMKGVRCNVI